MRRGSCQCGQVQFEFTGEPINQVFCYCTDCQKRTGSDQWFGIWVPSENFSFTGETEPAVYTTQDDAGGEIHCHTCPHCGVSLSVEFSRAGFHTVAAACIDGNDEFKLWIQPVDATHALNRSAGVSYPSVLRGRSLSSRAIAFNFA